MSWSIPWRHNDGAYTKLAMGPLWAEIMDNIRPIVSKQHAPPPNKLALFSAHDTTLAPLLVSLGPQVWDGQWPPYASMMIIEVSKRGCLEHDSCQSTFLPLPQRRRPSFPLDSRNY